MSSSPTNNATGTSRRQFLTATATTAGALLAGLPSGWVGSVYADDSPETKTIRFGIIALTDCAPIVMAHELGYFKKFGIESVISKEASWAVIRDKLSLGENQATHMLIGMPLASTMGLAGSPVKPKPSTMARLFHGSPTQKPAILSTFMLATIWAGGIVIRLTSLSGWIPPDASQ